MAEQAPQMDVPLEFVTVDSDCYEPGHPASAFLGARLSDNDRWLAANIRRARGEAFPQQQWGGKARQMVPEAHLGTFLGPLPFWAAPRCTQVQLYVRMEIGEDEIVRLETVNLQPRLKPPVRWNDQSPQLVGTGAAADYGPYLVPVAPGPNKLGYVLYPDLGAVASASGLVYAASDRQIVSTEGSFSALTKPYCRAIALYRVLVGVNHYLTDFVDVVNTKQSFVQGDTAEILSDMGPQIRYDRNDGIHWELRIVNACYVLCHYLVEAIPERL